MTPGSIFQAQGIPTALAELVAQHLARELVPKLLSLLSPEQHGRLTEALVEAFAKRIAETEVRVIDAGLSEAVKHAAESACKTHEGRIHDLVWERAPRAIDQIMAPEQNRFGTPSTSINPLGPVLKAFVQQVEEAVRKAKVFA